MVKHVKYCLALSAFALSFSAVSMMKQPSAAMAQSVIYVADTTQQVNVSSLVSGARYLLCQYSAKTSKYEALDGSTTSSKQIPFLANDFSSLADLQSRASSAASGYVTFEKVDEINNYWYIRRNSDSYYFSSNGSSDLVFSSSSAYSSTNRTYFVPSAGGGSNTIRFSVYGDSTLFLGTKVEQSYFDTWHDGSSVATKDFIIYRVYNQTEEAANYATLFDSSLGSTCSLDGNTDLASLHSAWASMSNAWTSVSSPARSLIKTAVANPDVSAEAVAQCKAKYLYIVGKYPSDPLINDFMNLRTNGLIDSVASKVEQDWNLDSAFALLIVGAVSGVLLLAYRNRRKKVE